MSITAYTNYNFSYLHGMTGTLAADPVFLNTKDGKAYAKMAVFCKAIDLNVDDSNYQRHKSNNHSVSSLIAYIKVFELPLLQQVQNLKKGYFVNFKFDKVIFGLGQDQKTQRIKANAFLVANAIEVKYIPNKAL